MKKDFLVDSDFFGNGLFNTGAQTISDKTIVTPPALTVNTDNYEPVGLENSTLLRISSTGAVTLSGILAPSGGTVWKRFLIVNVGASTITLLHNSLNSSAQNRVLLPNNVNVAITPNRFVELLYDVTSQSWRGR